MWGLENARCGPLLCNADLYLRSQVGKKYELHGSCWLSIPQIHEAPYMGDASKFHDFHNHGDIALISFQTYYGKGNSIFWIAWPTHHSLSDDAIYYTHQSAHLGGGV